MPMALMSPEEAVLHFKKWLSDETPISCAGGLHGFSFSMTGKVTLASLGLVQFTGTGPHCGLSLSPLFDGLHFGFADPRDLAKEAGDSGVTSPSTLAVLLPKRRLSDGADAEVEALSFLELTRED